jgi:predicted ester cyclase
MHEKGGCLVSLEAFKAKIRWAGKEAWMKGNVDALREVYAANYLCHRPPLPDVRGVEESIGYIAASRGAYSDIQLEYEDMICEGDTIAYRTTWRARHTGQSPTIPIPPTGKELVLQSCSIIHVVDGKIAEEYELSDYLGFLQQLGVVPPLG